MDILFGQFLVSLLLLFIGTQLLVNASITISNKLNINKLIIGFTIVSLATSLPEFFVTLQASAKGYYDYAIGNIIGSNISNISLVLGIMAFISPVIFSKKEIYLNYFPLIIITLSFVAVVLFLGVMNIIYGIIAITSLVSFNIFLFKKGKNLIKPDHIEDDDVFLFFGKKIKIKNILILGLILSMGSLVLWLGSEILINSSKEIASIMGISDRIISISLVAIGTSLPELFASIYAALKNESKLAIGNLLGSNIFNILAVLGATTLINDIILDSNLHTDTIIMLCITFILLPLFYARKIIRTNINQQLMIYRLEGLILLAIYISYISFVLF